MRNELILIKGGRIPRMTESGCMHSTGISMQYRDMGLGMEMCMGWVLRMGWEPAIYGKGRWPRHFWVVRAGGHHFGIDGICHSMGPTQNAEGYIAVGCHVCGIAKGITSSMIYQM